MKLIALMALFALLVFAPSPIKKVQPKANIIDIAATSHVEAAELTKYKKATPERMEAEKPSAAPAVQPEEKKFDAADSSTWPKCADNQVVWAQDGLCHDKPVAVSTAAASTGSGSCEAEIAKYDWPQATAIRVMMQESSGNPGTLNNNPATGDYSVGCFQINLYGANAYSRPSEATLKIASENVAYAYRLWVGTRSFWGNWPNTCRKVGC